MALRSFNIPSVSTFVIACSLLISCTNSQVIVEPDLAAAHAPLTETPSLPIKSWFYEVRDTVGRELSADLSGVDVQITDTKGIAVYAKASLLQALEGDLENPRFAENLVDNILTVQTDTVLAIYAPSVKRILLHNQNLERFLQSQSADPKHAVQALLIHELVHAADDKKYNAFRQKALSYQEVFAKSAIIEGHAQWQTRRICEAHNCSHAFDELNKYMFHSGITDDPALKYVQSRSFKNLEFVYKEGERFIDEIKKRDDNDATLKLAFKEPPRDSIQIIDPDSFPNKERERRNDKLSDAIERSEKPWNKNSTGTLKRNILAAAAFDADPSARKPVVNFYTSKILAATKREYYDHASDTPIPVAVVALRTDSDSTAAKTAMLIFESTLNAYKQLHGDLVEIGEWRESHHSAEVKNKYAGLQKIEMYTASTYIRNGLVGAEYPVEVVTATSGDYLVHIDGRYLDGEDALMQFAGKLLISMQDGKDE